MIDPQKLGLSASDLRIVTTILSTHVPGRPVFAFGSRATGKASRLSDLDLAVGGSPALSLRQRALLKEDFSESDLRMFVDVLDINAITPEFRDRIERDFLLVQDCSETVQVAA